MILDSLWKSVHLFFKHISSWIDFLKIIKMKTQFAFNALTLLLLIVFALEYRHYLPGFRHLWKKKQNGRLLTQIISIGHFCLKPKILIHFSWMVLLSIRWHLLIQMKARISGKSILTSSNIYHFKWPRVKSSMHTLTLWHSVGLSAGS